MSVRIIRAVNEDVVDLLLSMGYVYVTSCKSLKEARKAIKQLHADVVIETSTSYILLKTPPAVQALHLF